MMPGINTGGGGFTAGGDKTSATGEQTTGTGGFWGGTYVAAPQQSGQPGWLMPVAFLAGAALIAVMMRGKR